MITVYVEYIFCMLSTENKRWWILMARSFEKLPKLSLIINKFNTLADFIFPAIHQCQKKNRYLFIFTFGFLRESTKWNSK